MGVQIDPNSAASAVQRVAVPPQSRPRSLTTGKQDPAPPPLPKAGFGAGTASQATAAYVTLGRGLYSARQIVPTTEEIQAELQTRLAEIRAQREKLDQKQLERRSELRIPEPSSQVIQFERQSAAPTVDSTAESTATPESGGEARTTTTATSEPPQPVSAPGSRLDISA